MLRLEGETVVDWSRLLFWRSHKPTAPLTDAEIDSYRGDFPAVARLCRRVSWCTLHHLIFLSLALISLGLTWMCKAWSDSAWFRSGPAESGAFGPLVGAISWVCETWPSFASDYVASFIVAWGFLMGLVLVLAQYGFMRYLPPTIPVKQWIRSLLSQDFSGMAALCLILPWVVFLGLMLSISSGRICELAGALSGSEGLRKKGGEAARNFWIVSIDVVLLVVVSFREVIAWNGNPPASSFFGVLATVLVMFIAYSYGHLFLVLRYAARVLDKAAKGEKVP